MGFFWEKNDEEHKQKVDSHMRNVSQWINHLHNTDKEHHRRHNDTVNYLHQLHNFVCDIKRENAALKHELESIKKEYISKKEAANLIEKQEIIVDTKQIEHELLKKLRHEMPKEPQYQDNPVIQTMTEAPQTNNFESKKDKIHENSIKTETYDPAISQHAISIELSYSEKLVLNVLFSAEAPLSYEAIAQRLNKKPGTIKVYVNELKRKGIGLEEFNGPANMKLYALNNKEKVKKLYNIAV